jgi:ribosomal protein S18 acetylase RimI-like enzyme
MLRIRDFRSGDLDRIVGFKRESVRTNFPNSRLDEKMFARLLLKNVKENPGHVKVAEVDGEIAGYIWFKTVEADIGVFGRMEHLFVDERFRKAGIGKRLIESAERHFIKSGIRKVKLTVTSSNETAAALYRKLGYATKRLVMEKDL